MAEIKYNITLSKEDALKRILLNWAKQYNTPEFIDKDPIQVPRLYNNKKDIEICAFVTSWIAWGSRKQIIKTAMHISNDLFQGEPYKYIMGRKYDCYRHNKSCLYRTYTHADFYQLCDCLFSVYSLGMDLEDAVNDVMGRDHRETPLSALQLIFSETKGIPMPGSKSACKRLCMFLRWMVRTDHIVDLGIWETLSQRDLIIPLDTHVHYVAQAVEITTRNQADMKTAIEITDYFRKLIPDDPCLGDFALFGAGVAATNFHLICHQCGRLYDEFDSDAERSDIFCCKACENGY